MLKRALLLLLLSSNIAVASTTESQQRALQKQQQIINRQDRLLKQQDLEFERQKLREQEKKVTPLPQPEYMQYDSENCLASKKIILEGAYLMPKSIQEKILFKYEGKCVTLNSITEIQREITNWYFDKGYVTTRVDLSNKIITSEDLTLIITEGKIEKIVAEDGSQVPDRTFLAAFGNIEGKNLNMRDIEQGLDQMNALPSNDATAKLVPGSKDGTSKVVIENKPKDTNRIYATYDNLSLKSTGERRGGIEFEQDNILGLNDFWHLQYLHDLASHGEEKGNDGTLFEFMVPYGYWTVAFSALRIEFRSTITEINSSILSEGIINEQKYTLNRVLTRGKNTITSLTSELSVKDSEFFLDGLAIDNEKTTGLTFALDHTHRLGDTVFQANIAYSRGLEIFHANKDAPGSRFDDPRAQYDKFKSYFYVYTPFDLWQQSFNYSVQGEFQFSPYTLYSLDRVSIGDNTSVRGFKEHSLVGDSGGYIRQELAISIPFKSENNKINNLIEDPQFYVGFDYGGTRARGGKEENFGEGYGYMSGWAAGVKNSGKWSNFDISYSRGIKSPAFIEKENHEIYFNFSLKLN